MAIKSRPNADTAFALLHEALLQPDRPTLWIVGEELPQQLPAAHPQLRALSNRIDCVDQLQAQGIEAQWGDHQGFEQPQRIVYRVGKERALVNHVINQAWEELPVGGELWISGGKQEGIQSHHKHAEQRFAQKGSVSHGGGGVRCLHLIKQAEGGEPLDDKEYSLLRPIFLLDGQEVLSKPGLFGWDKLDHGSELLVAALRQRHEQAALDLSRVLDIGCGYGFLSIAAHLLGADEVVASDNNAAAILACEANFEQFGINGEVIGADCADEVEGDFSLVLCNPPFHQGFSTQGELGERFLQAAAEHLRTDGFALFVVNQFLPLERLAEPHFKRCIEVANDGSFQVFALSQPRH